MLAYHYDNKPLINEITELCKKIEPLLYKLEKKLIKYNSDQSSYDYGDDDDGYIPVDSPIEL